MRSCSSLQAWGRARGGKTFLSSLQKLHSNLTKKCVYTKEKKILAMQVLLNLFNKYLYIMGQ